MRKRTFALFIGYIWAKTLYGLVFHPYTSVREVTRRTVLLPVVFSPLYMLIILFIVGRIAAVFITTNGYIRSGIAFLLSSALISILLWQLLVIYLLVTLFLAKQKR